MTPPTTKMPTRLARAVAITSAGTVTCGTGVVA